ncbi:MULTISPECIES: diguanylate cyclase [unclassified Duganella]|uniref:GGDEF domain-containing protein n=1 Tax=unclassified Duganella TaxID=2636909 RepID=UPI000E3468AD|nr:MULTISPECIES: GGDEF domain-containing protein [unclassified Duganella]RFP08461.1 diguanylate cyclase [Duganella sp. BJB475]RFP22656.1 diguanylate cyclase [Duganella sp. BJB476]
MRLTRLFALTGAVLAILVCGMLGRLLWGEWEHYRAAGSGHHTLQLMQRAMIAAEKLSFERGPVNAVLGDHVPADPIYRARLLRARADTDQALAQLRRELAAEPIPTELTGALPLASLYEALAAARQMVDQLAALPPAQRTPERLTAAVERMFQLVPLALDAVTGYTRASEQVYPRIGRILTKARLTVELREFAGRLGSALTVPLASARPLTESDHERLQFLRGRIEQLRQLIKIPSGDIDTEPRVLAAVARMDQVYFDAGQRLVAEVEQASRAGRAYGMDTGQFAQRYVPCMAPILALRDVLLQEAQAQALRDFQAARHELMLALLVGAAILLALTLLLLILRRRVVVPLLRATRAVVRLGNGDFSLPPSGARRDDEIGDMLRALATLRANSMDRQRLEQERVRLIEELKVRADTDYLTGILNRRAFTAAGNLRLRGASERNESLAVILFDVDHFKSVNDSYGHDAGDQVLIRIADVVRDSLRDGEIVARYGGEEFVVMPTFCGLEAARALAERLREAIAHEPLTLSDGHILRVTASFGVAVAHGPHAALDDLFHAADLALYRAKHNGRNRVESQL